MKAYEMVNYVKKVERELAGEIAQVVNNAMSKITNETGLTIRDIGVDLVETSTMSSAEQTFRVSGVSIRVDLPDTAG